MSHIDRRQGRVAATLVYIMMGREALEAFVLEARDAKWQPDELANTQEQQMETYEDFCKSIGIQITQHGDRFFAGLIDFPIAVSGEDSSGEGAVARLAQMIGGILVRNYEGQKQAADGDADPV